MLTPRSSSFAGRWTSPTFWLGGTLYVRAAPRGERRLLDPQPYSSRSCLPVDGLGSATQGGSPRPGRMSPGRRASRRRGACPGDTRRPRTSRLRCTRSRRRTSHSRLASCTRRPSRLRPVWRHNACRRQGARPLARTRRPRTWCTSRRRRACRRREGFPPRTRLTPSQSGKIGRRLTQITFRTKPSRGSCVGSDPARERRARARRIPEVRLLRSLCRSGRRDLDLVDRGIGLGVEDLEP
jgi:hypothetical protein